MASPLLHCPIRGTLTAAAYATDKLTFSEEKRRIDCINFLLAKGYPPSHFKIETTLLRFGHKGKNSFRTDLAVLDQPASTLPTDIEDLKSHVVLIAEIKRDNKDAKKAKATQVSPALDFVKDTSALGIYWDDVEQRLFYKTVKGTKTTTHETTAAVLPLWGAKLGTPKLKVADLRPSNNLRGLFEKIEDSLHTGVSDKSKRFEIMLQLLLVKLYDEKVHTSPKQEVWIQDYSDSPLSDAAVKSIFDDTLASAAKFYGKYLPKPVAASFGVRGSILRQVSATLGPVKVLGAKREVVQDFYMYFAQGVYKWDLAQYFTPSEVVDFVVGLMNPVAGDQVRDPACGSGDFLISAFHFAEKAGHDLRDAIWGTDNSDNAVQVCVLNMVLNNDGKSNITLDDSLVDIADVANSYSVTLCNPPFGVRIQERRFDVLKQFDLGHEWVAAKGLWSRTASVLPNQQVGILFAELCVRQTLPGGRIGIILPNGYLGNRSKHYMALREWLLRHAKLVAVVACPRFTFKKSGADVSASVVILEKRHKVLKRAKDSEGYRFYAGLVEAVGWNLSGNKAERTFRRNPATGAVLTDSANEPIPDSDFSRVMSEILNSPAAGEFPWLMEGREGASKTKKGWSVSIHEVLERADLCMDAKRWCERAYSVRKQIAAMPHFRIGDVAEVLPESPPPKDKSKSYRYVELEDTSDGVISPTVRRGWEMPQRARHTATKGDIYVGRIWGSVSRWFVAGGNLDDFWVSNGFHRLRMKKGKEDLLVDLIAGLNTEAYRIQARSFSTGSDGLAELSDLDLKEIVLPTVTDPDVRTTMQDIVDLLLEGRSTVHSVVSDFLSKGQIASSAVTPRTTNWVQV